MAKKALGLLLPLRRGNNGYFNQGLTLMDQAKSNLINLILTKKGERIMQPDFGCDVYKTIFEPITDNNIANIKGSITSATKIWLPYINIVNIAVVREDDYNKILATIVFNLVNNPLVTNTITLTF